MFQHVCQHALACVQLSPREFPCSSTATAHCTAVVTAVVWHHRVPWNAHMCTPAPTGPACTQTHQPTVHKVPAKHLRRDSSACHRHHSLQSLELRPSRRWGTPQPKTAKLAVTASAKFALYTAMAVPYGPPGENLIRAGVHKSVTQIRHAAVILLSPSSSPACSSAAAAAEAVSFCCPLLPLNFHLLPAQITVLLHTTSHGCCSSCNGMEHTTSHKLPQRKTLLPLLSTDACTTTEPAQQGVQPATDQQPHSPQSPTAVPAGHFC